MTYASYMICTAPRSGSTLLCDMLTATGCAGDPDSLFYRPALDDWTERLDIAPADSPEPILLNAIFRAAIARGRGTTGIFGLRQQRPSFPYLCEKMAVLHPDAPSDIARIERTFGPTLFIHLTRPSKLDQAISLLKAEQSGLWHVATDGSDYERTARHRDPLYDRDRINAAIETLTAYDQGWSDWFDAQGLGPLRLTYDDLAADPRATLRRVLDQLGLPSDTADTIAPGVRKMADATSRDWAARYRAETAP